MRLDPGRGPRTDSEFQFPVSQLALLRYMFCPNGEAELREFWHEQRGEEWVLKHPAFTEFHWDKSVSIPMGIHADKGQHIKKDKILVIAWGSVMCRAPTVWSKVLYTVVPDEVLIPRETDERLYAVLVWSFQWLLRGTWPPTDHDGNPWPAGSRRALNGEAQRPLAGSEFGLGCNTPSSFLSWGPGAAVECGGMRWLGRTEFPYRGNFKGVFSEYRGDWEWSADTFGWRIGFQSLFCSRWLCRAMAPCSQREVRRGAGGGG